MARGGRQLNAHDYGTRTLWDTDSPEQPQPAPSRWESRSEPALDARFLDLDTEPESPFLRAQKRVPVRRGPVTRKTATRLRQVAITLVVVGCGVAVVMIAESYAQHASRFRIASRDAVLVTGSDHVPHAQLLAVFAADIGRNIFFIPVDERKRQLEQIAWVRSATVMRLLPNRLSVEVQERTPVAFAQVGSRVMLIDADGMLLEQPIGRAKYSFPVISGMAEAEPLSTRAARMKIYTRVIQELDSGGARYSESLSEVDLSDPEDVKITVADDDGAVLVHLGNENFLERFKTYIAHVQGWRQQFQKLDSVDLRYDKQVIVNPESSEAQTQTVLPQTHTAPVQFKPRAARTPEAVHQQTSSTKTSAARWHASNAKPPAPKAVPRASTWKPRVAPAPAAHKWQPHRSKRKTARSARTSSFR